MARELAIDTHRGEMEVFIFWCSGLNCRHLVNQSEVEVGLQKVATLRLDRGTSW